MIATQRSQISGRPRTIFGGCQTFNKSKNSLKKQVVANKASDFQYTWNSEKINQILYEELDEQFPTYYDELKNLDDTWKPISLQGEKSKALLFLPFLPKWQIQNDKRIFTGIWDVRNKQQYDLNEKFVQIIWPQIKLLDQRILGTLLANGHVVAKTPQIYFSLKRAQNVYWKYVFLKPFSNLPPKLQKYDDKRTGKTYYSYFFVTRSVFKDYRQLFYPDGIKTVPLCASTLLQASEGLAEIYMDVGHFKKSSGGSYISIDSFQREEQEFIQQQLQKFYGLESSIVKKNNYLALYLPKNNNLILISKLKKHLLPMFYYKLGLENQLKPHEMQDEFNRQDLRELQRSITVIGQQ